MMVNIQQGNNPQKTTAQAGKSEIPPFYIKRRLSPSISCFNSNAKAWSWNMVCQCIFFG